jgi:hypothetical protein
MIKVCLDVEHIPRMQLVCPRYWNLTSELNTVYHIKEIGDLAPTMKFNSDFALIF